MDVEKLKLLRTRVQEDSILIVEDCDLIQKQLSTFLKKFFKTVYQAYDGVEGIECVKKNNPSIIVTDLSMPKKGGLDMIKEIRFINDNVKVIILSAHNEEDVILDSIKLNVDHFLLKPLNIDKFIDILINISINNPLDKYTQCLHDLELLYQQKGHVRLVNYFKDVVIEQEGEILKIIDDIVSIKIPHIQILAIDHEGNTIIELKSIKKFMRFKLLNIDKENNTINLSRPMYTEYTLRNSSNRHYFYDGKFSVGLHDHHKFFAFDVLDISKDTITMFVNSEETKLVISDHVNITIPLDFDDTSKNKDIFARGMITSILPYRKGLRIIAHMEIEEKDKIDFKKYLSKIEDEIINELIEL